MHHMMYLISSAGGYAIIVYSQVGVVKYLKRHGTSMRESTRKTHAEVNRALIALVSSYVLGFPSGQHRSRIGSSTVLICHCRIVNNRSRWSEAYVMGVWTRIEADILCQKS